MSLIEVVSSFEFNAAMSTYSHDLIVSLIEVYWDTPVTGGAGDYSHDLIVSLIEVCLGQRVAEAMGTILTI